MVKPKPTLSSTKYPAGICTGFEFSYTATTATQGGNIIGWTRKVLTGISNAAASEAGVTVKETLINTTSSPVEVTYTFSLEADGCINEEDVKVWVTTQSVISIKNATANEGDNLEFEVALSGAGCAGGDATVSYTTIDQAAVAPDDYSAVSGTLTFSPGETSKKIRQLYLTLPYLTFSMKGVVCEYKYYDF